MCGGRPGLWCDDALSARVLAECESKRRIVEEFQSAAAWVNGGECPEEHVDLYRRHAGSVLDVLRLLALPYADHPDYRPEWRP